MALVEIMAVEMKRGLVRNRRVVVGGVAARRLIVGILMCEIACGIVGEMAFLGDP